MRFCLGLGNGSSKEPRSFTGTVTKMLDNFGFVDDNVFFQLRLVSLSLMKNDGEI